jgi:hypothetical protein
MSGFSHGYRRRNVNGKRNLNKLDCKGNLCADGRHHGQLNHGRM